MGRAVGAVVMGQGIYKELEESFGFYGRVLRVAQAGLELMTLLLPLAKVLYYMGRHRHAQPPLRIFSSSFCNQTSLFLTIYNFLNVKLTLKFTEI